MLASYASKEPFLIESTSGRGRVTSVPAGLSCPGTCKRLFAAAPVRLVAKPATGWRFAGWSGSCRGAGACSATGAAAVRARFAKRH